LGGRLIALVQVESSTVGGAMDLKTIDLTYQPMPTRRAAHTRGYVLMYIHALLATGSSAEAAMEDLGINEFR
jgi:hypothetical protein